MKLCAAQFNIMYSVTPQQNFDRNSSNKRFIKYLPRKGNIC